MKSVFNLLLVACAVLLVACGGNTESATAPVSKGKKFAPQQRVSSLTAEEREAAIAKKVSEIEGVNVNDLLANRGVKFSIVQPHLMGNDITQDISDRITMKLLQISSQNGISGLGVSPHFVFGVEIVQNGRAVTATTPQKMTVQYNLTFVVQNIVTGDVYATATQDVLGVGNSFIEANQNFVKEIKNTAALQAMLQTASDRIIEWYSNNAQTVKNQIESAEQQGDYAFALALAMSVPEQATEAFEYASGRVAELSKQLMLKKSADMYCEMVSAIAAAGDDFDPAISAYFKLIPSGAAEQEKAQAAYKEYRTKCEARRKQLEEKAERDEQAAREFKQLKMKYTHEEKLAEFEMLKITTKYTCDEAARKAEAQARVAVAEANAKGKIGAAQAKAEGKKNSFFGSIGYAISGTFDRVFKAVDKM